MHLKGRCIAESGNRTMPAQSAPCRAPCAGAPTSSSNAERSTPGATQSLDDPIAVIRIYAALVSILARGASATNLLLPTTSETSILEQFASIQVLPDLRTPRQDVNHQAYCVVQNRSYSMHR